MVEKGLIGEMLERITALETRVNELENNKQNGAKKYYTIEELSELTGYSVNYLYKKVSDLKKGEHYFKPNGGKLLFDESSVDFLVKGENQNGESIHESRQPVYLGDFLN